MAAFDEELEDLVGVGNVGCSNFRLWKRMRGGGRARLELSAVGRPDHREHVFRVDTGVAEDFTFALRYPDDIPDATPLVAGTRYELRVEREGGGLLGESAFETSPGEGDPLPDRFAIAVMSCHQPFDEDGELNDTAARLLERMPEILERYAVKRVLLLGDQMYADMPKPLSLFDEGYFERVAPKGRHSILDCTQQEVRALYQQRHRIFFNSPGFQRVLSRFPCMAIVDDHEIIDNFGSHTKHGEEAWANLRAGALQAAFDYQGSRTHGREEVRAMDFGFRYGPFACYVLDLRSERRYVGDELQVYGPEQLERLRAFVERHADASILALALSVPLVHLPDWASELGMKLAGEGTDVADRWSNPDARPSRRALLELLASHQWRHSAQKLVLLGGDVHVGLLASLRWQSPPLEAVQLTSSAVSNSQEGAEGAAALLAAKLATVRRLTSGRPEDGDCEVHLAGEGEFYSDNPYGGLNVGIVQFQREGDGHRVELKLVGLDDQDALREVAWASL